MQAKAELEEFLGHILFPKYQSANQNINLFFQILDTMQNDVLTNA